MGQCNCFIPKFLSDNDQDDYTDELISSCTKPETTRFIGSIRNEFNDQIFTISNPYHSYEFTSDSDSFKSQDNSIYVYTDFASSTKQDCLVQDSISLDSGFNSRNLSPIQSNYSSNLELNLVLNIDQTEYVRATNSLLKSSSMSNLCDFVLNTHESSLAIDSLPQMFKRQFIQWSSSSLRRLKQTALKLIFIRRLNQNYFLTESQKESSRSNPRKGTFYDVLKRPFSILGFLSGLSLFPKSKLKYKSEGKNEVNGHKETDGLFALTPFRQFLLRLYNVNLF